MAIKKEGWGNPFTSPEPEAAPAAPAAGTSGQAAPAEPAVRQEPAPPVTSPEPSKPQGAGEPSAAASAAAKKWKIPGKVAGEDKVFEVGEDDFDEAKSPEGFKRLRDTFQKAADYDRTRGRDFIDEVAEKRATQREMDRAIASGIWVKGADGKLVEAPEVKRYREWKEAQARGAAQPATNGNGHAAPAQPAAPAQTPRQKRLAELEAVYEKEGLSLVEQKEFTKLQVAEEREADDRQREETRVAREQQTARERAQSATREQQEAALVAAAKTRIKTYVAGLSEKLKDPVTGKVDPDVIEAAESLMDAKAQETQDWAQAEAFARKFAEGHAARLARFVTPPIKTATAPPPPPVHRGGGASPHVPDDKDGAKDFDATKSFQKQKGGFTRFVEAEQRGT